ncbi:MAG: sporulation protein YqfC [Clostridia bacterium]|nr:sporulation protein YqfC [Clostridia bacterium]
MDIARAISDSMEIPCEVTLDIPKITLVGNMRVHIENYLALVEYKKENIKLKYKGGIIEVCGQDFDIRTIGEGNIVVCGKIDAVKLI